MAAVVPGEPLTFSRIPLLPCGAKLKGSWVPRTLAVNEVTRECDTRRRMERIFQTMIMAAMNRRGRACDATRWNTEANTGSVDAIIRSRFQRSPYLSLRRINCFLHDGVLSLRGRVPTSHAKQLAQTIAASIEGVQQISNELHVDFPEVRGDV